MLYLSFLVNSLFLIHYCYLNLYLDLKFLFLKNHNKYFLFQIHLILYQLKCQHLILMNFHLKIFVNYLIINVLKFISFNSLSLSVKIISFFLSKVISELKIDKLFQSFYFCKSNRFNFIYFFY